MYSYYAAMALGNEMVHLIKDHVTAFDRHPLSHLHLRDRNVTLQFLRSMSELTTHVFIPPVLVHQTAGESLGTPVSEVKWVY